MSDETNSHQLDLIERALDYIEDHLLDSPRVVDIANACDVSRTHLQRLFSNLVGQSVGSYCQRRRLCLSMDRLLSTDQKMLEIAIDVGFKSQAAYTRAFRAHFGVAPATFREEADRFSDLMEPRLTRARLEMRLNPESRVPRLDHRGEEMFIGVVAPFIWAMSDGTNVKEVIPSAWERFDSVAGELARGPRFSLTYPAASEDQRRGDEMLTLAGVRVESLPREVPDGLTVKRTPPARFAVFRHSGPRTLYTQTVVFAFQDWLPYSEFEYDAQGVQLRSMGAARGEPDEFWMPVVSKGEKASWRKRKRRPVRWAP
ncbi:MAG: AraC family transcriptional regulator [bacterium]|nr:AraC family transcriptional regulator [bacterium]